MTSAKIMPQSNANQAPTGLCPDTYTQSLTNALHPSFTSQKCRVGRSTILHHVNVQTSNPTGPDYCRLDDNCLKNWGPLPQYQSPGAIDVGLLELVRLEPSEGNRERILPLALVWL